MSKPKLQIIVLFQNLGDSQTYFARSPAPPLSGLLVAGLTLPVVEVEVLHEMVRPIDYDTDADFIALSFLDYCSPHAYEVAARFRKLGKKVVAGGKYASTFPQEVSRHFDATVVGEAEQVWPTVVNDLVTGKLERVYEAPFSPSIENIPPPRYDLAESEFEIPVVTEATRGCPFRCTYCALNIRPAKYRVRPIKDVIRDLTSTQDLPFQKRKMAMIYDNNLGGDRKYAKALLREVAKLKLWGVGMQFTFDCLNDDEFVDLLFKANCRMAFIGMESLNEPSLRSVEKRHNKVEEYKKQFEKLRKRGILIFTGLMFALDEDTRAYYETLPQRLDDVDPSAILSSISIPIPGTPFHNEVESEGRIFDHDLSHYEGDHLVFTPRHVTATDVFHAFKRVNEYFYSWKNILKRWLRFLRAQSSHGSIPQRIFRSIVTSFIYWKLSVFQRHHAIVKVYPFVKAEMKKTAEAEESYSLVQISLPEPVVR